MHFLTQTQNSSQQIMAADVQRTDCFVDTCLRWVLEKKIVQAEERPGLWFQMARSAAGASLPGEGSTP